MKKLAILYDCPYPYVLGGGQKRLFEVATRLAVQGWQVDWFSLKFWEGTNDIQDSIRYHTVGERVDLYNESGKRTIGEAVYYGAKVWNLRELRNFDIILCGQWPFFHLFPARFFSEIGGGTLVVDWWETWDSHWFEYYGWKGFIGIILERICSRIPKGIISISELGKQQLVDIGVSAQKIRVIPNGIDFKKIRKASPSGDQYDLIYIGRLQHHKNIDHLLEALAILKTQFGLSLTLQIIGDGPAKPQLEKLSEELGVRNQVLFTGLIQSDQGVYSRMKSAKIFVHPSTKEGGGSITLLEANACGLPIIAYRHPAGISSELIESGRNGAWVDEIGPSFLAEAIKEAFLSKSYLEMGPKSIDFSERYDWKRISVEYDKYFSTLLE